MTDRVFFPPQRSFSLGDIAAATGSTLQLNGADENCVIRDVAQAACARAGHLAFVEGRKNRHLLDGIKASAVLVTEDVASSVPEGVAVLVNARPYPAFAKIARMLHPAAVRSLPLTGENGISARAFVHSAARLEHGVIIEAGAVIGSGAEIGEGTVIGPNVVIGPECRIGRDCRIGANATLQAALLGNRVTIHPGCQIGQDGFGYVPGAAGLDKVPQIGRVVIQDDVEIGSNSTVDRGALDDTVIGAGTKIDNLVQIAHNVKIGNCCAIAAHVGLSGSVKLGNFVMLGGRVGIADHLTVGDGAQIAAAAGVMHDVPAGEKWAGAPAMPIKRFFRQTAALRALAEAPRKKDENDG